MTGLTNIPALQGTFGALIMVLLGLGVFLSIPVCAWHIYKAVKARVKSPHFYLGVACVPVLIMFACTGIYFLHTIVPILNDNAVQACIRNAPAVELPGR